MTISYKVKHKSALWSTNFTSSYPKEMKTHAHTNICTRTFMVLILKPETGNKQNAYQRKMTKQISIFKHVLLLNDKKGMNC